MPTEQVDLCLPDLKAFIWFPNINVNGTAWTIYKTIMLPPAIPHLTLQSLIQRILLSPSLLSYHTYISTVYHNLSSTRVIAPLKQ